MSAEERTRADRRWLDWMPSGPITADSPASKPTKPSKPSSVGFEGAFQGPTTVIGSGTGASWDTGTSLRYAVEDSGKKARSAVDCALGQERVMSWSDWKAAALNRLFLEQGIGGQPGRITAETVRHGQQAPATKRN